MEHRAAKKKAFQITSIAQPSLRTLRTVNHRIHPPGGNQLHNYLPLVAIFRSSSLAILSSSVSLLIPDYTLSLLIGRALDITFCGDWAGNSYATSGCPGTCAERIMDPSNFVVSANIICAIMLFQLDPI